MLHIFITHAAQCATVCKNYITEKILSNQFFSKCETKFPQFPHCDVEVTEIRTVCKNVKFSATHFFFREINLG